MVERNLIVGNREGFNFREQARTTRTIANKQETAVWNHDELVEHNVIAFNRDAQIRGWFDMKDNRHWPATNGPTSAMGASSLTLKDLRLRFIENVYFAAPGQGWFEWGPGWARHKSYPDLGSFQTELAVDARSRVVDPGFSDLLARDFRLNRQAMDRIQPSYPRSPVPGVLLGLLP